jgi:hypothetical protein
MDCTISTLIDLPEALHQALSRWLDRHPEADQSEAIAQAVTLLLTREEV